MFPIIPLLALIAICGGGATLIWYDRLSKEEQEEADRLACGYARQLYGKSLKELTTEQAQRVNQLTYRHFNN